MNHTRGPWHTGHNVYGHSQLAVMTDHAVLVAEVVDWPLEEVTESNARLIAAAPDLLAACEWLISAIGEGSRDEHMIYAKEQARAAIAKARGET